MDLCLKRDVVTYRKVKNTNLDGETSFSPLEAASWDSWDLLFVRGYESKIKVEVLTVVCFLLAGGVVGNFIPDKIKYSFRNCIDIYIINIYCITQSF